MNVDKVSKLNNKWGYIHIERGVMLRLRPYKIMDAKYLIEWMEDEKTFVQWCANHLPYPLSREGLAEYKVNCDNSEDSWLLTAIDENGKPVGHILVKLVNFEENSIHLGHVIVDSKNRCKGLGKDLLKLALIYAFDVLRVSKVTLGVFDNNPIAYNCYKSLGFEEYEYFEKEFPYHNEMWGCYNMQILSKVHYIKKINREGDVDYILKREIKC